MAGHHVVDALAKAFVGNVRNVQARHALEHFTRQMLLAARAAGGVADFAGLLFGQGDQLFDIVGRKAGEGQHHKRASGHVGNRAQVSDRVVGDVGVQIGRNGDGRIGRKQQGVAVGDSLGNKVGANGAAGAGFVFHHHRLFPQRAQLLRQHPAINVGRAAGREGDDDLHRLVGKGLRAHGARQSECGQSGPQQALQSCFHGSGPCERRKPKCRKFQI